MARFITPGGAAPEVLKGGWRSGLLAHTQVMGWVGGEGGHAKRGREGGWLPWFNGVGSTDELLPPYAPKAALASVAHGWVEG